MTTNEGLIKEIEGWRKRHDEVKDSRAKLRADYDVLCRVELELRAIIIGLLTQLAPTAPTTELKRALYGYDLWPLQFPSDSK